MIASNDMQVLSEVQEFVVSGTYAALYRRAREALEAEAEQRLGRPLTPRERNLFRSCGTLTSLEALGMTVYIAATAEELAANLAATSMDSRFSLAVDELVQRLEKVLGRPVTGAERQRLRTLGNTEELWALEQSLQDVLPAQREKTLAQRLNQQR